MELFLKNDRLDENLIEKVNVNEIIANRFHHINRFLHLLQIYDPTKIEQFLKSYRNRLLIRLDLNTIMQISSQSSLQWDKTSILGQHPDIIMLISQVMLKILKIEANQMSNSTNFEANFHFREQYRATFIPEYEMALALIDIVPRISALALIKEYTRGYYLSPDFQPKHEEKLVDHAKTSYERSYKTHKAIYSVDHGKLYFKVQRCLYAEMITDLTDKEVIYYLECYGDYFNHPKYNENFVLTRTKTLMKGNSYCDFCYHDKREIEEIYHPEDSVWHNLEQLEGFKSLNED